MRRAIVFDQPALADALGGGPRTGIDRHGLVGGAVNDQCRDRERPEIRAQVALLAITLVGALTLLQSWPRADVTHILFGLQPTFIVFGYLLYCAWRATRWLPRPRAIVATIALPSALAPLLMFLWKGYQRTDWEYQNYIVAIRDRVPDRWL